MFIVIMLSITLMLNSFYHTLLLLLIKSVIDKDSHKIVMAPIAKTTVHSLTNYTLKSLLRAIQTHLSALVTYLVSCRRSGCQPSC